MFRLWGRIWKNNRLLQDMVIENAKDDTRTHKIFDAITELCYAFDLEEPIWLDSNVREFKQHTKTRFYKDNFIEDIPFDYFEIQIIEEDEQYQTSPSN